MRRKITFSNQSCLLEKGREVGVRASGYAIGCQIPVGCIMFLPLLLPPELQLCSHSKRTLKKSVHTGSL